VEALRRVFDLRKEKNGGRWKQEGGRVVGVEQHERVCGAGYSEEE